MVVVVKARVASRIRFGRLLSPPPPPLCGDGFISSIHTGWCRYIEQSAFSFFFSTVPRAQCPLHACTGGRKEGISRKELGTEVYYIHGLRSGCAEVGMFTWRGYGDV